MNRGARMEESARAVGKEFGNLRRAHELAYEAWISSQGQWETMAQLALALDTNLGIRGPYHVLFELIDKTLDVFPEEATTNEKELRGDLLISRGDLHLMRGNWTQAEQDFAQAKDLGQAIESTSIESHAWIRLGNLANQRKDDLEIAASAYQSALTVSRKAGDKVAEGRALGNMGVLNISTESHREAEKNFLDALAVLEESKDKRALAVFRGNLGSLQTEIGRLYDAEKNLRRCLKELRELGDRRYESLFLLYLGRLRQETKGLQDARDCYERALKILREIGEHLGQATAHLYRAFSFFEELDFEAALEDALEGYRFAEKIGKLDYQFQCKILEGALRAELGQIESSRSCFDFADNILGENTPVSKTLTTLFKTHVFLAEAKVAEERGQFEEVEQVLFKAENTLQQVEAQADPEKMDEDSSPAQEVFHSSNVRVALRVLRKRLHRVRLAQTKS